MVALLDPLDRSPAALDAKFSEQAQWSFRPPGLATTFRSIREYVRFVAGYRAFLQETLTLRDAENLVRYRLARRDANFLRFAQRNIFANPESPYLPLMRLADCTLLDLQQTLASQGLEETLRALRRAGVYFSFEEYKGRSRVIRDGREIPMLPRQFDNPRTHSVIEGLSGGSTGKPSRVVVDLDFIEHEVAATMLAYEAHRLLRAPMALWMGLLPDASGPKNLLRQVKSGQAPRHWFVTVERAGTWSLRAKSALYNASLVWLGRAFGGAIPRPRSLGLDEAGKVVGWMSEMLARHGCCLLYTQVSRGVRVAAAAAEHGIDLTGATFVLGAEPLTSAKAALIRRTGARCVPVYAFSEHGHLGLGCADPRDVDDVHLFEDSLAMIQWPRQVPGHEIVVESFHWTSLTPSAPKILLNVESDDCGIVERRECGCALGSFGFGTHVRNICSYRKLTGEGITLIGSDAVRILEEILPARFGGGPLDYQLVEEEDVAGLTRATLYVDPSVPLTDEAEVIRTFVSHVSHSGVSGIWGAADTLRIKRCKPLLTGRGKLFPLRLRSNAIAD